MLDRFTILSLVALALGGCGTDASSAAGALGAPKTTLDHKVDVKLDGKVESELRVDTKSAVKIVAPDMIQKDVAKPSLDPAVPAPNKLIGETGVKPLIGEDGSKPMPLPSP